MAEKRRDDGQKEETEKEKRGKKINKRSETDKRRGRINSKVGEGAFSDEIRSRGRSEFGYLIHGGGKNRAGSLKGSVTAGVRTRKCARLSLSLSLCAPLPLSHSILVSFSPSSHRCKWNYADPALQTALYSPHLRRLGRIDN